jgi:hypothetical protein
MLTSTLLRQLLVLLAILNQAVGTKDDSYYPNGVTNPNVRRSMYWHDAHNVIEDLSQFAALYVQFHSCAWTPVLDQSNERKNVDENDYWYMNAMADYGPNVAYSLFGVMDGDRTSGCSSRTYINSFYTTAGFPEFASALANHGVSNTGSDYSASCNNGVGITCADRSGSSGFTMTTYDGDCRPEYAQSSSIPTDLAAFNSVLKNDAQCVQIYSSGDATPSILQYSRACSLDDGVGACPNPYGKKSAYDVALMNAAVPSFFYHREIVQGAIMYGIGFILLIASALLMHQGSKNYPMSSGSKFARKKKGSRARSPKSKRRDGLLKVTKREKSARSKSRKTENEDGLMCIGSDDSKSRKESKNTNVYLAPEGSDKVTKKLPPVDVAKSKSVDAPSSPSSALTKSPTFAGARSNIEIKAPDSPYDESDHLANEWGSKPSTSYKPDPETGKDGMLGGFGAWLGNTVNASAQPGDGTVIPQSGTSHSDGIFFTPSFLAEADDGDESGPEGPRSKSGKIRRFMGIRRKQNQPSAM